MIVVVTYSVKTRFIGYFSSCLNQISSGVFISTISNPVFRESLINTVDRWWEKYNEGSILIVWKNKNNSIDVSFKIYGEPKRELMIYDDFIITKLE